MSNPIDSEKPFAGLDGTKSSATTNEEAVTVVDLVNADEALAFLTNHHRAVEIAIEGNAILEDPEQRRRLIRKIDFTIAPLLAAVYFLQYLDKTTLSYTAIMGIRTDTHLKGQEYAILSMLFYVGMLESKVSIRTSVVDAIRISRRRVPYPISRATYLQTWAVSWSQHHALGIGPRMSCSMHYLYWALNLSNIARDIRKLRRADPRAHNRNVVQEGRTGETSVMVLCLQLSHSNLRRATRIRSQLRTRQAGKLENILPRHWRYDHDCRCLGLRILAG